MKSPIRQVSPAAIELLKRFEGFRSQAACLDDGSWTIGYGHTKSAREGAEVTQDGAEALLIFDMMEIAEVLEDWIYTPLTQNEFDAVAAFVFSIGLDAFWSSDVLRLLNAGATLQAACAMEMWRLGEFSGQTIVVDALVRRRAAEKALFLTPPEGFVPTPSAVLRPRVDLDGGRFVIPEPVHAEPILPEPVAAMDAAVAAEPPPMPQAANESGAPPAAAAMDAEQMEALFSRQVDPIAMAKSKGKVKVAAKGQGTWWRRPAIGWDLSLHNKTN